MLPAARATLMAAAGRRLGRPRDGCTPRAARPGALLDDAREVLADGARRAPARGLVPARRPGRAARRSRGPAVCGPPARLRAWSPAPSSTPRSCPRPLPAAAAEAPSLLAEVPVDRLGRVDLSASSGGRRPPAPCWLRSSAPTVRSAPVSPSRRHTGCAGHDGVPLLVDAQASLGRDAIRLRHCDVLVGDARSWGGPAGVWACWWCPERTRWRRPGPVSEAEHGRTDAEPVVRDSRWPRRRPGDRPQASRARTARARSSAIVRRLRAAAADVRDVEVVGDPDDRLPHVVTFCVPLRRRRGAGRRARPAGLRRGAPARPAPRARSSPATSSRRWGC